MRALLLAIMMVACSRSDSKPEAKQEPEHHEDHAGMSPALHDFHDLLSPLWHAAPGDQRTTDTCNAVPDFIKSAAAVGAAPLADAVKGLADACAATPRDPAKFDAAFARVHETFHARLGEH